MALTPVETNQVKKLYGKQLWKEGRDELFFKKFMGEGEFNIIQEKTDFRKDKGDTLYFGLGMDLSGAGVTGDNELEGNEEALTVYSDSVTVDQIRNAVRVQGRLEEQKAAYGIRETAKERLKFWLAEKIDEIIFDHLCGDTSQTFPAAPLAPDSDHVLYGGNATSDSDIDSTDKFTAALISKTKVKAQTLDPRVKPVKVDGKDYYVCVIHPYQAYDLRQDTDWQNAHYYASERGLDNPIFTGSMGIYDGVAIHVHPKIYTASNWGAGANVEGARALFLGAQAGLFAQASDTSWVEKDFDYANQTGVATGLIWGFKKARFNSEDFGLIALDTAASAP